MELCDGHGERRNRLQKRFVGSSQPNHFPVPFGQKIRSACGYLRRFLGIDRKAGRVPGPASSVFIPSVGRCSDRGFCGKWLSSTSLTLHDHGFCGATARYSRCAPLRGRSLWSGVIRSPLLGETPYLEAGTSRLEHDLLAVREHATTGGAAFCTGAVRSPLLNQHRGVAARSTSDSECVTPTHSYISTVLRMLGNTLTLTCPHNKLAGRIRSCLGTEKSASKRGVGFLVRGQSDDAASAAADHPPPSAPTIRYCHHEYRKSTAPSE